MPPLLGQPAGTRPAPSPTGTGRRIALNALTIVTGRGLSLLLSAVAGLILARYLGTRLLGEYGAIYAYLTIYSWVASFGIEWVMAGEISRRRDEGASILMTGVVAGVAMATVAAVVALAVAPLAGYTGQIRWLLPFAAVDALILTPMRLAGTVFQVDLRQWYSSGINAARQFLWIGAVALLALFRAPLSAVILARLGCSVVEVALLWGTALRLGMLRGPWKLLTDEIKGYLAVGLPIAFSTLAVSLYHRIDQVMLFKMVGGARLGPYVVAVNMTELFTTLPVALMAPMFPLLARAWREDVTRFHRYISSSFRLLMTAAFLLCPLVVLLARPLVLLLYGEKFAASGPLLAVLIWSEAAVFFEIVITNTIVARGLQRYLPLATAIGAIVNIALNVVWIPRYGAMGSAWATNVSYVIGSAVMFLAFSETRPYALSGLRSAARPCLLALVILAALLLAPIAIWLKVAVAMPAYLGGLWLTGGIEMAEIRQIQAILGGIFDGIHSSPA